MCIHTYIHTWIFRKASTRVKCQNIVLTRPCNINRKVKKNSDVSQKMLLVSEIPTSAEKSGILDASCNFSDVLARFSPLKNTFLNNGRIIIWSINRGNDLNPLCKLYIRGTYQPQCFLVHSFASRKVNKSIIVHDCDFVGCRQWIKLRFLSKEITDCLCH